MFTVDLRKLPELASALDRYTYDVRLFLENAKKFYGMTRAHRYQRTQQNLHPNYPEHMEYIRYHVQALMDSIIDHIQGKTGGTVDQVRRHISKIRQLIRTNEDELYEPDEDES